MNFVIVTHKLFNGASQDLYKYLKKNKKKVLLIEHDFSSLKTRISHFTFFNGKKELVKNTFNYFFLPDLLCYVKDFLYSFIYLLFKQFDVFIGAGGFNALIGVLLKKLGRINKVIFYTIDFVPKRFDNKLLNKIYHLIDKYCVLNSDEVWNLSPRMAIARKKLYGIKSNNQKVVPIGVWLNEMPKVKKLKNVKQLVFVGHLLKKQGVQLVIESIPLIIKRIPNFRFLIIGGGEYFSELKRLVNKLKIQDYVIFTGPIYDSVKINKLLGQSHLGIAMYNKRFDSFTYYADPTKIKTYLAMGLPVLLTDVPYNAKLIEKEKCGLIIKYDKKNLSENIIKLLSDDKLLMKYSRNAKKFIKKYDWNKIFNDVL